MALTTAQAQAVASAIAADTTLAAHAARNEFSNIADALNQPSNPAVQIWHPATPTPAIVAAIAAADMPATAAQIGYLQMLCSTGTVDATSASVRAAFSAVFTGKAATLAALTAASQRRATRFEALFTTANVCSVFGQSIGAADVQSALGK